MDGLSRILEGVSSLEQELAGRPEVVASLLKALGTPCAAEYADAVLGWNGFGGDVAEIYFYRFAPEGSPRPGEDGYAAMRTSDSYPKYAKHCYDGFLSEITNVEEIVTGEFKGQVTVNGLSVAEYARQVTAAGIIPDHRVNVKVVLEYTRRKKLIAGIRSLATQLSESGE